MPAKIDLGATQDRPESDQLVRNGGNIQFMVPLWAGASTRLRPNQFAINSPDDLAGQNQFARASLGTPGPHLGAPWALLGTFGRSLAALWLLLGCSWLLLAALGCSWAPFGCPRVIEERP